jgi:hypothetical protein
MGRTASQCPQIFSSAVRESRKEKAPDEAGAFAI